MWLSDRGCDETIEAVWTNIHVDSGILISMEKLLLHGAEVVFVV